AGSIVIASAQRLSAETAARSSVAVSGSGTTTGGRCMAWKRSRSENDRNTVAPADVGCSTQHMRSDERASQPTRSRAMTTTPKKIATVTVTDDAHAAGSILPAGTYRVEMPADYDPAKVTGEDILGDPARPTRRG